MEEYIGQLWHRLITRAAHQGYPKARITLTEVMKTVGIIFRALGGESGVQIETVSVTTRRAKRTWLQRIAGTNLYQELAWRDSETLRLPAHIELFPEKALNRELYLWLAALAASTAPTEQAEWATYQQQLTANLLQQYPGLQSRYQRLVEAYLSLRPLLTQLTSEEQQQEQIIQQILRNPNQLLSHPQKISIPIPLWLHPPVKNNARKISQSLPQEQSQRTTKRERSLTEQRRRQGERVDMPDGKKGLLASRLESLFTRAEHVKVDRCTDDEEDIEAAKQALDDMDTVSIARDNETAAVALRFQVDLPSEEGDNEALQTGILLPEWDYRQQILRPKHCRLHLIPLQVEGETELPSHLRTMARRLRRQFESLKPLRSWHKNQSEGSEIDLDAYLSHLTDCQRGQANLGQNMYRDYRGGARDLACLLLADLSMSTDAWVNNHSKVIDIIRDSLFLFAEALSTTGDKFALHGFCSYHRQRIEFYTLKSFDQSYNAAVRGRIRAIKPRFYTRLGAAIRHAAHLLGQQKTAQRLLLLLTDGKPNDMDLYEGRYGVEDTRMALHEARKQGLQVFCVTIDERAQDYLPHIFGNHHYVVIRNPADLPKELPLLYARLVGNN